MTLKRKERKEKGGEHWFRGNKKKKDDIYEK